jgi:hypothetical protein
MSESASITLVVVLAVEVIIGAFCGYLAADKNKNSALWFVLGFLFSLVALIAAAGMTPQPKK